MYGGSSRARNTFCNGSGGHRYEDLGTPPYNVDIEQLLEPSALGAWRYAHGHARGFGGAAGAWYRGGQSTGREAFKMG